MLSQGKLYFTGRFLNAPTLMVTGTSGPIPAFHSVEPDMIRDMAKVVKKNETFAFRMDYLHSGLSKVCIIGENWEITEPLSVWALNELSMVRRHANSR